MDDISSFFYAIALAQMLFCALVLVSRKDKSQLVILYVSLMLASSAYLLGNIFSIKPPHYLFVITFLGGNSLLGIFWLVSLCLFSDHIKINYWHYAIGASPLCLPVALLLCDWLYPLAPPTVSGVKYLVMAIELSLICHALLITLKYWRGDLIQQRRFLRAALISFVGIYLLLVIVLEQIIKVEGDWLTQIESTVLASLMTFINFYLMQMRELSLFPANAVMTKVPLRAQRSAEVERILSAMTEKSIYQQEGLTITALAKILNMYEYKLRNVINGELGYRNFNDFLNEYRIKEVTAKLQNSQYASMAILNLALDSGFRSLSCFNKAFKDKHHLTPSEFRKRHATE